MPLQHRITSSSGRSRILRSACLYFQVVRARFECGFVCHGLHVPLPFLLRTLRACTISTVHVHVSHARIIAYMHLYLHMHARTYGSACSRQSQSASNTATATHDSPQLIHVPKSFFTRFSGHLSQNIESLLTLPLLQVYRSCFKYTGLRRDTAVGNRLVPYCCL